MKRKEYVEGIKNKTRGREIEKSHCYHDASIGVAVPISVGLLFRLEQVAVTHKVA